ncbi:MAG: arsenate reductase ArsC [Bacteroidetes bacterium]|nr:arsenate reductase ArsC [Bacteroidota bacterium]HET6244285.1 arsenate reductase ArsC [Bacteroidia bacterium]
MKVLILCTGNSCRSQMAHGFLKSFDKRIQVFSAGTEPAKEVNPKAVLAMKEVGIDIGQNIPHSVNHYLNDSFDFVITVCDSAKESCPVFTGKVKQNIHIGFDDPYNAKGSDDFIHSEFRRVRDEIKQSFYKLYEEQLVPLL